MDKFHDMTKSATHRKKEWCFILCAVLSKANSLIVKHMYSLVQALFNHNFHNIALNFPEELSSVPE